MEDEILLNTQYSPGLCLNTVTTAEYWSTDEAKSFQSDAGGWQHHSSSWEGS